MAEIIFWLTVGFILYTYLGYPFLILLLSFFINNEVDKRDIEPSVTILITAYNEEKNIRKKLEDTLSLDYSRDKLEIIVASDASTDKTDDIVKEFADKGVVLYRVEGRVGKTEAQNQAVQISKGDIIIFSDATTKYETDAVRKIVRNYNDPSVGMVSGRYEYVNPTGSSVGLGISLFWKYENFIKKRQTKINSLTGASGCIHSVMRSLYIPLERGLTGDLVEPLKILQRGYRIVFEPEALAYETSTQRPNEEFKMRTRVISQGMYGLLSVRNVLNPFKYGFISLQLLSHKVLRWLVAIFAILLFMLNLSLLGNRLYDSIFYLQCLFYGFAFLGSISSLMGINIKVLSLPLYFCVANFASLVSLVKVLMGKRIVTWETVRANTKRSTEVKSHTDNPH